MQPRGSPPPSAALSNAPLDIRSIGVPLKPRGSSRFGDGCFYPLSEEENLSELPGPSRSAALLGAILRRLGKYRFRCESNNGRCGSSYPSSSACGGLAHDLADVVMRRLANL